MPARSLEGRRDSDCEEKGVLKDQKDGTFIGGPMYGVGSFGESVSTHSKLNGTDMDSRRREKRIPSAGVVLRTRRNNELWRKKKYEDQGEEVKRKRRGSTGSCRGLHKRWWWRRRRRQCPFTFVVLAETIASALAAQFAAVSFPVCVLVCLCLCAEGLTVCVFVLVSRGWWWHKKFTCLRCCLPQTAANFYALPTSFFFISTSRPNRTTSKTTQYQPTPSTTSSSSFGCCFISFHLHFRVSFSFFLSDVYRFLFGRDDCQLSGGGWIWWILGVDWRRSRTFRFKDISRYVEKEEQREPEEQGSRKKKWNKIK